MCENSEYLAWIKRLKESNYLDEALRRAGEPVTIYKTDETGEVLWAVSLADGFWMDAFNTKDEAEEFVEKIGWTKNEI